MIIALTGTMGSGKGEVAKYLQQKGHQYLVYSDVLREIAKRNGIEATRQNLHKIGREVKENVHDPGYLSKQLLKRITKEHAVVDGVRNIGEIRELKNAGDAFIIGVTAPQRIRFLRIRKRMREGDPLTFAEFKRIDNIENRGRTKGQEINACLKQADFIISNNKGVKELHQRVEEVLRRIATMEPH